jgi:TonB-dependent receptor
MRRLPFLILLLLVSTFTAWGQSAKGILTGRVADSTGAVIQGASIQLTQSGLSANSDGLGEFIFPAVAPGTYTLKATSAGFSVFTKSVTVVAGQALHADVQLAVLSSSEQVVVTAESGKNELQAINEEINAPNILQVMPETQILSLPNANMADAIGRMPGVTLQRDEGEGVYIQVRGLDPRLTNLTIDGVTIPSPEAAVRQINLATIPSDMIQSIELNKTLSANQDADGIGGSVNLVTKMAGERPTLSFGTDLGYTPIEGGRYVGKVDLTLGQRFGAGKRWGVIMGAGYDYNGRGINDIEPDPQPNPDGTATPYYDKITQREYRYQRLRWGGTMGADYKLSDHSSLFAHFLLSDFKDWGDKWYYELKTDKNSETYYESTRRPDFMIGSLSVGGNHVFTNKWVTWGSSASRSRELNSGGNPEVDWGQVSPAANNTEANMPTCSYVGTPQSIYRPQWSAPCMTASSPVYDLNNYGMTEFITTTGRTAQLNLQEWASMGLNYHLGSRPATFEFGGQYRNAHKYQYAYTPTYDAPLDANGNPTIVASQFQSGFADPNYYDGSYHVGPFTNYYKETAYFAANPGEFALDEDLTHEGSDSNNFNLLERVGAGYIMNTINWDHFRLQTGLRIEGTTENTLGYIVTTEVDSSGNPIYDPNGNPVWAGTTPSKRNQGYWDPLPSIQARWEVAPLTAIRAVYARGISRPNQYDLVPYFLDNGAGSVPRYSIGNPSELPTHANNYDVLVEQQLKPFGLIQVGYFYKQLNNPIVTTYTAYAPASSDPAGDGYPDIAAQNINAAGANVSGLEFAWDQRFTNLPGSLAGLGARANYAYTQSHTNGIPDRTDHPPLIGQARHAFNLEPYYERGRYQVHFAMSYNGANDQAYQYFDNYPDPTQDTPGGPKGPLADNYFYPHMQIDAQGSVRLFKGLLLTVDGLNMSNEVFGFYNGSPQYMTQREYYKPTYSASLRWSSAAEK